MTISEYNICVNDFADRVYRFVVKQIRDMDLSQDIVQEAYIRLWENRENLHREKSRAYLFTTAYRLVVDQSRKAKVYENYIENTERVTACQNSYSDSKDWLNYAVEQLPKDQKTVILLRDYEGYSYQEIGEITHLSEAQVKTYIYRARIALKKSMENPKI